MFAHDLMTIKLEILRTLGASEELINDYCPEVPKKAPHEILDDTKSMQWRDQMFTSFEDYLDFGYNKSHLDALIVTAFCLTASECPYCCTYLPENSCSRKCSYGHQYGYCSESTSHWSEMINKYTVDDCTVLATFSHDQRDILTTKITKILEVNYAYN